MFRQDVSALGKMPVRDRHHQRPYLIPIANLALMLTAQQPGAARCRSRIDFHSSGKTGSLSRLSCPYVRSRCLHVAAAFRTFAASFGTVFHTVQLIAAFRAGIANFGTHHADLLAELRTAQHEIKRGLTHLRAVHHKTEMVGLHMLAACFKAVVHG